MSLYFFHLRDGVDILLDPEGQRLDGPHAIAQAALKEARSMIAHDAVNGRIMLNQHIDVKDESGNTLHTLHFTDAVKIDYP